MPTITVKITDEQRENLLTSAIEGGSNYWYFLDSDANKIVDEVNGVDGAHRIPYVTKLWKAIKAGKEIPVKDMDDMLPIGKISMESIEKAEQIMADKYPDQLLDITNENDDAGTADTWFQLAVMGELVYG